MPQYDVIVIGAGVVGCMVARWLSRYELSILLIEQEADIGTGASAANSAIVHAGYDPPPGTLKALTNVRGNAMWDDLAGELNIPFMIEIPKPGFVNLGGIESPGLTGCAGPHRARGGNAEGGRPCAETAPGLESHPAGRAPLPRPAHGGEARVDPARSTLWASDVPV